MRGYFSSVIMTAAAISLFTALSFTILPAQPSYDNYHLVWSDEFDVDGLPDPGNWRYEKGCSIRNDELQYYAEAREKNSRVEDGLLILEAHRESMGGCEYTSASLPSWGKREFRYGIFEMRGKIDVRKGSWPAFWTLGVSEEWPSNGEVDIMEYYNGALHANVAWGTDQRWNAKWDSEARTVGSDFSDDFHIWRMHWTEDVIDLWVDDFKQNSTDLSQTINGSLATLRNPFHQKAYIMLNQAIGSNGGDPSGTEFPIRFLIDYVRVYQEGADTTAPVVLAVTGSADGTVTILFSEVIDLPSAGDPGNFSLSTGSLTITGAELQRDGKTVVISVSGLEIDAMHMITVNGISDNAEPPNTLVSSSHQFLVAPKSEKLNGTIISKGEPRDGNSDAACEMALDGDTATYADCVDDVAWVGYDLGSEAGMVITEIRYYPRPDYAERMEERFFEVSNNGEKWEKIHIITTVPPSGEFTSAPVVSATPVRYIRYNGSGGYCNVAEIEFYGYAGASIDVFPFNGRNIHFPRNGSLLRAPFTVSLYTVDGRLLDRWSTTAYGASASLKQIDAAVRKRWNGRASGLAVVTVKDTRQERVRYTIPTGQQR